MRLSNSVLLTILSLSFAFLGMGQTPDSLNTVSDSILSEPIDTSIIAPVDSVDSLSVSETETDADTSQIETVEEVDTLPKPDIVIEFVKPELEHSADSIYFNICKVTNTTDATIRGNFELRVPDKWNIIADPSAGVEISPGETKIFVVRVGIANESIGGMAYAIDATLTTDNALYSGAAYVRIPLITEWEMAVNSRLIYFNEYFDEQEFNVFIKNKGNSEELIKLNFEIGKLFQIDEVAVPEFYVSIPALTDSVFTYTVRKSDLNEEEFYAYSQMWNERVIKVTAESDLAKRSSETIQFVDLENEYVNQRGERSSPLNADLSVYNLLSSIQPRLNLALFGQIQFTGQHDLTYFAQARNLRYTNTKGTYFQNGNNFTFNARYEWRKILRAELGEIVNYSMHSMRGWGVRSTYKINDKSKVSGSYIFGKYFPQQGANIRYDTRYRNIGLHAGVTYEDNNFLFYDAVSTQGGVAFSLAKKHLIRVTLLGTRAVFDQNQNVGTANDTTVYGMSYLLSYNGSFKKFRFGANTRNDQFNFLRIRPANSATGFVQYLIDTKSRVRGTAIYRSVNASKLAFIPYLSGTYNNQQIYRLGYNRQLTGKLTLEGGPSFRILNRVGQDSTIVESDFTNYFSGIYALTRIRFDEFRLLTPTISAGVTTFRNQLAPADSVPTPMPTFNVGINFKDRNWGANANYIYGPNFFLSEDFFNFNISSYETVNFRMYYNKFLYDRKMKFSGFGNYYLRLPSNRQNLAFSGRFDFILPKGWEMYTQANIFTNSVDFEQTGVVKHRNFSMNVGVRKAFDIPQPRVKYYKLSAICFKDLNGNGERDENEPLLSNIKVNVSQDLNYTKLRHDVSKSDKIFFGEQVLVTSTGGQISIVDIPEGDYVLAFEPLVNLGNLYNVKGDVQEVSVSTNTTLYIPYVESYKVRGRVILNRDEYSSLGLINIDGIRVTATNITSGEVFAALTDNEGNYLISVPQGGDYKIKVNNIFGNAFEIDKEEFLIQFNNFKSFNVDFTFFEGKREVSFGGNSFFNFKSLNESTPDPVDVKLGSTYPLSELNLEVGKISYDNLQTIRGSVSPSKLKYNLCVGVINKEISPAELNALKKLGFAQTDYIDDEITIYISKPLDTQSEVDKLKGNVTKTGFKEVQSIRSYLGKIISDDDAVKIKTE